MTIVAAHALDASEAGGRLAPRRLARIVGRAAILGGLLTWLSVVLPHADHTYDAQYAWLGGALGAYGVALLAIGRRRPLGLMTVHVSTMVFTVVVLAYAWMGMHDLGGIQAILLILVLGISASIGPTWWASLLFVLQSAGYGVVLATTSDLAGFDKPSQWQVVTIALVTCLAFNTMVRRELERSQELDAALRAERDRQRELHAERLERLNDELRQASELKSSFVAMASHELRTPLTAIEGFAATMQYRWDDLADGDKRSFVGVIDAQSRRLSRLVEDLLLLSRIEGGRLVARIDAVDLSDVLARTIRELGEDTAVDVACPAGLRACVDPDHLQQMLVNFLANARLYGEPPVRVDVTADAGEARIVVSDQGGGVDEAFVPRLFDRFARDPGGTRPEGSSGTGLGLSIVEGLAEANGGQAFYEPNEPRGSRFGVRLPLAD